MVIDENLLRIIDEKTKLEFEVRRLQQEVDKLTEQIKNPKFCWSCDHYDIGQHDVECWCNEHNKYREAIDTCDKWKCE